MERVKQVNALNTIWELRLDKPYKNGGSEHSERVGMKGQGNLPNLSTVVAVDGRINDASHTDVGWGIVAKIPFSDLIAAGHCTSPPAPLDAWCVLCSAVGPHACRVLSPSLRPRCFHKLSSGDAAAGRSRQPAEAMRALLQV